jgi:hypothetical protein
MASNSFNLVFEEIRVCIYSHFFNRAVENNNKNNCIASRNSKANTQDAKIKQKNISGLTSYRVEVRICQLPCWH